MGKRDQEGVDLMIPFSDHCVFFSRSDILKAK